MELYNDKITLTRSERQALGTGRRIAATALVSLWEHAVEATEQNIQSPHHESPMPYCFVIPGGAIAGVTNPGAYGRVVMERDMHILRSMAADVRAIGWETLPAHTSEGETL